jgi:hypothetical protein
MFIRGINFAVGSNTQLHRVTLHEITSAYRKIGWGRDC